MPYIVWRSSRARHPRRPARYLLGYERQAAERRRRWNLDTFTLPEGKTTVLRDGFTLVVTLEPDYEYSDDSVTFTDRRSAAAVQNPNWRPDLPGYNSVYRYFVPQTTIVSEVNVLRDEGMAKHEAWLTARKRVLDKYHTATDGSFYSISVRCSFRGVELGRDSCCGIEADPNDPDDTMLLEVADEVIHDALYEARRKLALLREE